MRSPFQFRVGLALGGGAARGVAHIGVLRALEEERIPIDVITGTSMGAIVGGAYAVHRDMEWLEGRMREVLSSEEFQKNRLNFLRETKKQRGGMLFSVANLVRKGIFYGVSTLRPSFLSAEEFADSIGAVIPDAQIEDLEIPFGAVALDLESAQEVVLCRGDLHRAADASSAIPGILPPVTIDGRKLIDGGWVDKVPVLPAFKLGADVVIAIDISSGLEEAPGFARGVDIMVRANVIKDLALVRHACRFADVLIEPDVKHVHWADFGAYDACIEAGYQAVMRAIPEIRSLLRRERWLSVFRAARGRRLAELHMQADGLDLCVLR